MTKCRLILVRPCTMHVILLIIAVNAVLIAFACLIAGWSSLIGADETELADLKHGVKLARQKSWIHALRFAWNWRWQYPASRDLRRTGQSADTSAI